jgi:hypothetical protein
VPSGSIGYQVTAVHADRVGVPATTPPIAVLDSGVGPVRELAGRVRRGANLVAPNRATDDHDGHGTAAAMIAAGGEGPVRGIAPTAAVIPITIFDRDNRTSPGLIARGIAKARALGARVINLSVAGLAPRGTAADRALLQGAIDTAASRGIPVVVPTGNEGLRRLDVPAGYAHVVAVGATDETGAVADFSNTGSGLDLVAPGAAITTAVPAGVCASGYGFASGTSFAAPAVAGAASMLLAAHPDLDITQLTNMLRFPGGFETPPAWRADIGFGMLDVAATLAARVPPADAPEVDDTIAWSKHHPPILRAPTRTATVRASVATHTDPADTFRVQLRRGDRFRAVLTNGSRGPTVSLSNGWQALARGTSVSMKVAHAGAYYVTVHAGPRPPQGARYTLVVTR